MVEHLNEAERAKLVSAWHAAKRVEPGMRVGLGTGSTAAWLVRILGHRVRHGLKITGVPTSTRTATQARAERITIATLDDAGWLDLTIDGADEFDPELNLIKGAGGALLQEKIVAMASDQMLVITDERKEVDCLGAFPLPVEVVRFGWATTQAIIEDVLEASGLGGRTLTLRTVDGAPYVTDEGHHILDLHLRRIEQPGRLSSDLLAIPGVVETGLFVGIAGSVIIGQPDGRARVLAVDAPEALEALDPGMTVADILPGVS